MCVRILPTISVLWFLGISISSSAATDTFDDGLFEAECVAPTAGWFVPLRTLRASHAMPPEDVVAAARPMTAAELAAYVRGGEGLRVSEDYPLFAFPNQGSNAFLWTGRRDGEQQILPRRWNGDHWEGSGHSDGRSDVAELVFSAPPTEELVYVLLYYQGAQAGGYSVRTERIRFARFPGTRAILDRGIARADAVVWIPYRASSARLPRRLDCLKGRIDAETFRSLPGAENLGGSTLVFISGAGATRRVDFVFDGDTGVLTGRSGSVFDPEFDRPNVEFRHFRWRLARRAAGSSESDAATLSVVDRGEDGGDGWIVLELSIGSGAPGELYEVPITRSGRDGGGPLFQFEFSHAGSLREITTRGRFGADSFDAVEPETESELGIDYRFVRCGPGVVKLEFRPRTRPWRGTVLASVAPWVGLGKRLEERVSTSPLAIAAD